MSATTRQDPIDVAVIGGGPAGLMAAETIAAGGRRVVVFDAMPSPGRKFLLAGKGGLNLTHAEPPQRFVDRYGAAAPRVASWLAAFGQDALRAWCADLGIATFVGSSGRVFPVGMKSAPLLRAWLRRLRATGVELQVRHRWQGCDPAMPTCLRLATPSGERRVQAAAVVLALGGGSWPQLGSDGAWVAELAANGIEVAPLRPANCGFEVASPLRLAEHDSGWSEFFSRRFAGQPLKSVALEFGGQRRVGEMIVSASGLEGSLVYACSAPLRQAIDEQGAANVVLDLLPDHDADRVARELAHPRGARSWSSHLQSRLGLRGVKVGLLRELLPPQDFADPARIARAIKALPVCLRRPRPLAEAISSAGGVRLAELDESLMLYRRPGVFCAGEMIDWEAPTGGYLITACLASGRVAGRGALAWLAARAA